ncbi:MAG TPA: hypothetical protein VF466_03820 [Candidatus Saccharimonadales bacterium]
MSRSPRASCLLVKVGGVAGAPSGVVERRPTAGLPVAVVHRLHKALLVAFQANALLGHHASLLVASQ